MKKYSIILTAIITCVVVAGCYNPSVAGGPCHEITGQCTGSLVCAVIDNRHVCTAQGDGTEGSSCGSAAPCDPGFRCVLQEDRSICLITENKPGGACVPNTSACPDDFQCRFNNGGFTCSPPSIGSSSWSEQIVPDLFVSGRDGPNGGRGFRINDIHYYDGTWLLGSSCGSIFTNTNADIRTSSDWESVFAPISSACTSQSVNAIHRSGSTWRVATDADLGIVSCRGNCANDAAWPEITIPMNINADNNPYDIGSNVLPNLPDEIADIYSWGDHWVAVTRSSSTNDKILVYDEADSDPAWSSAPFPLEGMGDVLNVVRYGSGYWVAAGGSPAGGVVYTSSDRNIGDTQWTRVAQDVGSAPLVDIHYNGTEWVAIGENATLITSRVNRATGAFAWTAVDIVSLDGVSDGVALNDIHYDDGTWVVVGDDGTILRRTDDGQSTWESRRNPLTTTDNLNALYYAPGTWVAVGDNGTIITSEDGVDWIVVGSTTTASLWDVQYGGGIWVVVGGGDADDHAATEGPVILVQYDDAAAQ